MLMKKLSDVFPNWLLGEGIFSELTDAPWSEDFSDDIDIEYFGNNSGDKLISPLVEKLLVNGVLSDSAIEKITTIIKRRFYVPWTKLYATLSYEYDPLKNFNIHYVRTPNLTKGNTHSDSAIHTVGTTETTTENLTETRTPNNLKNETTTEEETVNTTTASDSSSAYGLNSSYSVPTTEGEDSATVTTTRDPIKNKVTTIDSGSETTTNGGTTTVQNTGHDDDTSSGYSSATETGTDVHDTEGFRAIYGMQSQQVLLGEERESWLWQFFSVVFRDVDSILTIPIYE